MMKMIFRRPPIAPLRPFIESIAAFEQTSANDDNAYMDIPSTYSYIVFNQYLSAGKMRVRLIVRGSHPDLSEIPIKGFVAIGPRIWPGCLKFFMNTPSSLLQGRIIPLESVWGREARELLEILCEESTVEGRLQVMEEALLRRLVRLDDSADFIEEATNIIQTSQWRISMRELADCLGFTNRQLERKFLDYSGFTPKEYFRTMRCRSVVQRINRGLFQDWGQLINEYNYYDQSHFIREFSQAMKQSPGKYFDQLKRAIQPLREINPEPNEEGNHLVIPNKIPMLQL